MSHNYNNLDNQKETKYLDTTFVFEDKQIKVEIENNKFHGNYIEKYKNGNYKTIGEFYQGQRVGIWSIWDKNQTLIIQRNYKHNKKCDFIFPISDYPYKNIYDSYPAYEYKRNKNHFYPYHFVEERAVVFSKRIYRELNTKNEPLLFKLIDFKKLTQNLLNNNVNCYQYGNYCDFKQKINYDSIKSDKEQILLSDFNRVEIIGDFYFNSDKLMGNTRQVSINIFLNKEDEYPKYSFYYPEIRQFLAKIPIESSSICDITNLDDYFFFNNYRGEINNSRKHIFSTSKNLSDWETELRIITTEHNLWIGFGK